MYITGFAGFVCREAKGNRSVWNLKSACALQGLHYDEFFLHIPTANKKYTTIHT